MRLYIRSRRREPRFSVEIDPKDPPAVVKPPAGEEGGEVVLYWDGAIDDEGHLRQCPVCGCRELFVRKNVPQLTVFVLIVLAAVAFMVLAGMDEAILGAIVLGALILLDAAIYFLARPDLVCYRCRTEAVGAPVSREHKRWDPERARAYEAAFESDQSGG